MPNSVIEELVKKAENLSDSDRAEFLVFDSLVVSGGAFPTSC
ncbi:MAG: hypothetical protein ACRD6X_05820 [Pyrinomonadaceae bacterium]